MNERYIHKNYSRHNDSIFDSNDEQDLEVKALHQDKRCCYIATIIDADKRQPSLREEDTSYEQKVHLMLDTFDIFHGRKKETDDYHDIFNSTYFIEWMEKCRIPWTIAELRMLL